MIEILKTREIDGKIVLSKEDFEKLVGELESLIETLEILSDNDIMSQISKSEKDIKEGKLKKVSNPEELRRILFEV